MKNNAGRINLLKFLRDVMGSARCSHCRRTQRCDEFESDQLNYRMWPGSLCKTCSEDAALLARHKGFQLAPRTLHEVMFSHVGGDEEDLEYKVTHGRSHELSEGVSYQAPGTTVEPTQFCVRNMPLLPAFSMFSVNSDLHAKIDLR